MRELITIGELSKMMKVQTSSIRFYEKKGLIKPEKIDENGYRLYDFRQLDRLENILLFRELDIPLKEIEKLIRASEIEEYKRVLKEAEKKVEKEIRELQKRKDDIKKKVQDLDIFSGMNMEYQFKRFSERRVKCVFEGDIWKQTLKELYDLFSENNVKYIDVYRDLFVLKSDIDLYKICMIIEPGEKFDWGSEVVFEEGEYLCKRIKIEDETQVEKEKFKLKEFANNRGLKIIGPIIGFEDIRFSQYEANREVIELQGLIKR